MEKEGLIPLPMILKYRPPKLTCYCYANVRDKPEPHQSTRLDQRVGAKLAWISPEPCPIR